MASSEGTEESTVVWDGQAGVKRVKLALPPRTQRDTGGKRVSVVRMRDNGGLDI